MLDLISTSQELMRYDTELLSTAHSLKVQKQPPRQFSKTSVLFFQEQHFYNFPGGSICSSNKHEFSRRVHMFFEQTRIFQEGYSKRHVFSRRFYLFVEQTLNYLIEQILILPENLIGPRTHTNFPGASIFSSNRYSVSRKPYLVLEHLRFSRKPLYLEHISIFQEGTPSRTDISLIGLGGCFRKYKI